MSEAEMKLSIKLKRSPFTGVTTMKALITLFTLMLIGASTVTSQPRFCVQQQGLQPPGYDQYFRSIKEALDNVQTDGTIIKVYPGKYQEKVVIGRKIVLEGSGAETTLISNQSPDYAVEISDGELKWFSITSQGSGVRVYNAGVVNNCVSINCYYDGFVADNGGKISHSISTKNLNGFLIMAGSNPTITNCIAFQNTGSGFLPQFKYQWSYDVKYCNSFANGKNYGSSYSGGANSYANKSVGSSELDPVFLPNSYNVSSSSPCKDTGNPAYTDPDGSPPDIGYYGGDRAPTFPVVINPIPELNPDGTITIKATGVSRY